jgi:hypothetical protein
VSSVSPVTTQLQPLLDIPIQQQIKPVVLVQQQQQQPQIQQQVFSSFFNSNTFGYFINTDSAFGNSILPVLPRF